MSVYSPKLSPKSPEAKVRKIIDEAIEPARLRDEIQRLETENEILNRRIGKVEQLEELNKKQKTRIKELENQLEEEQRGRDSIQLEICTLRSNLSSLKSMYDTKIKEYTKQINELANKNAEYEETIQELEKEKDQLK